MEPTTTIATIQRAVCTRYGITLLEMLGTFDGTRTRRISGPRQVAMYLVRGHFPSLSLPQIGRAFRRDHTTVMHAIRAVERALDQDDEVAAGVAWLQQFFPRRREQRVPRLYRLVAEAEALVTA